MPKKFKLLHIPTAAFVADMESELKRYHKPLGVTLDSPVFPSYGVLIFHSKQDAESYVRSNNSWILIKTYENYPGIKEDVVELYNSTVRPVKNMWHQFDIVEVS